MEKVKKVGIGFMVFILPKQLSRPGGDKILYLLGIVDMSTDHE